MSDDELLHRDEILQLLYWLRGEKIGEQATREQLNRFLQLSPEQLDHALQQLIAAGLIEGGTEFRLTASGVEEGKRRFVDEFTPFLGKESHIECQDPTCDCHSPEFAGVCKNL